MCLHKAPHREWEPHPKNRGLYQDDIAVPETFDDDYKNRARAAKEAKMRIKDDMKYSDLGLVQPEGGSEVGERTRIGKVPIEKSQTLQMSVLFDLLIRKPERSLLFKTVKNLVISNTNDISSATYVPFIPLMRALATFWIFLMILDSQRTPLSSTHLTKDSFLVNTAGMTKDSCTKSLFKCHF